MDITDLRVLATLLAFVAMVVVAVWAFGPSRRQYFRDASQMPFADEDKSPDEDAVKDDRQDQDPEQTNAGENK
jgi:cytochrome c oxidase cbb3-type subunit 4